MSIFKTIASKVKRVVSLKNVMNAVTGNYVGIGQDAVRIATTKAPPSKAQKAQALPTATPYVSTEQAFDTFEMPATVNDYLAVSGAKQKAKVTNAIANSPLAQDNVGALNNFVFSVWLKASWIKYKTWIIIGGVAILGFIGWRMYSKKSTSKGRARR
ncbi:hypothetical protein [Flavobacterium sp.]|uniref:hypothetical protein n=1 Tax=Flavobacterium sp. TaxID=239 RepID=UPI0037518123